ncbi:WD40 repeat-like protein [Vararia minispora EC-137]|uniref:WD40 repeat-like protein n=1 Tax=Vararia minispora EC-137 TaxID=1314806 RepID=A0ACB8QQ69_9AGAM|nr:WD40 repeat-like protein [Vararia minispora EC-137]
MNTLKPKGKLAFKKTRTIGPLYTGGPVAVTTDGQFIVTCIGEEAVLTDLGRDLEICRFQGDTSSITSLCITPSGRTLCVFTSSMAMLVFAMPLDAPEPLLTSVHPTKTVARAHDAPVHVSKADPTSTYLASGSADGIVKVWDIAHCYPTHVLRGHGGVISALLFSYPHAIGLEERVMRLITASVDTRIRVWNLARGAVMAKKGKTVKPEAVLEGHVSVPRGLDITPDGKWLISGGRDSVVLVWNMEGKAAKGKEKEKETLINLTPILVNTITVLERVEAIGLLAEDERVANTSTKANPLRLFTAGENGVIKIWDAQKSYVLCVMGEEQAAASDDQEEQRQIVDAIYVPSTATVISIHADQNILFYSLADSSLTRQLIGFNDEVIDAAFISSPSETDSHIALAANSSLIRLYSANSLDARLLSGHKDIVLCLATSASGRIFASAGKDRIARIWAPRSGIAGPSDWSCIATCEGHAESIGALTFARRDDGSEELLLKFLFTGSQDRTIKMWDLSSLDSPAVDQQPSRLKSLSTFKAHEKDINALDVSPNDALLASGSQDKTVKVFTITYSRGSKGPRGDLTLLGTCKGHKRGVWSVRFARAERVLATGSGDRTVRIWSLDDFACLRVLEGHANSVLRVDWLGDGNGPYGGRIVSAGADGLVKVWETRSEECLATLDGHEDKVWALAVSKDTRTIVSGAADSVVNIWQDCTEEQEAEQEQERANITLREQDFLNYVALNDYRRAIELALSLAHPGRLFKLFKDVLSASVGAFEATEATGHPAVDSVLRTLHPADLTRLMLYIRDWNTRAATASVAQRVLYALIKLRPTNELMGAFEPASVVLDPVPLPSKPLPEGGMHELVEALIPYTERHLARMERLVQESYVVDYVLGEMDGLAGDEGEGIGLEADFVSV